jgi:hypothetical protein
MRTEDREKMVEALGSRVPSGWSIETVGPDSSSAKENGVKLINSRSDTVLLIGVAHDVRRADRVLKVFHNGQWVDGLGTKSYKGRGWIERAIVDMIDAASAIDAAIVDHRVLLMKAFEEKVPLGWILGMTGETFSRKCGVDLTNRSSDTIRVIVADDSVVDPSYGLRVFFQGSWSEELSGAVFSGAGWHDLAVGAAIEAASAIDAARTDHRALLMKSFEERVPLGWILGVIGEPFSMGCGVSLTNRSSDTIQVIMVDDSVDGLSYELRVFFQGSWSEELGGAAFSGIGWHDSAIEAAIEVASRIGEARS